MQSPEGPPIGDRVVNRTADELGRDPLELQPLATVIDPALLGKFAASDAVLPESELQFRYCDCQVRVHGTGEVELDQEA